MVSLETASYSFHHLPQHTQLLYNHRARVLEDTSSHSCAPPPPQMKSYYNSLTNETSYIETEVRVNEIGILFNYEIRHASDVTWEDFDSESGDSSWVGNIADKAGDFFGGLFGGDDEEEDLQEAGSSEGEEYVGSALLELEQLMADEVWYAMLADDLMTWVEEDSGDVECAGLVIEDETRQLNDIRYLEGEEDVLDTVVADEGDVLDTTELEGGEGEELRPLLGTSATAFSGTKLLGLTYEPLDYVNPNGCTIPASTCTAISGQVSVAYAGINEYGVIQAVIEQLRSQMEAGKFIPFGSPALNVEFQSAGGTAPVGGNGQVISLSTDRGTEEPEEDALSKYGTLFVCLVGILGAGFMVAMYVRYKKRLQRKKEMNEGVEITEEDYEANLALQEQAMDGGVDTGKTEPEGDSSRDSPAVVNQAASDVNQVESDVPQVDSPDSIINQVELDVPPVNSGEDCNEVEISLTASKTFE